MPLPIYLLYLGQLCPGAVLQRGNFSRCNGVLGNGAGAMLSRAMLTGYHESVISDVNDCLF